MKRKGKIIKKNNKTKESIYLKYKYLKAYIKRQRFIERVFQSVY